MVAELPTEFTPAERECASADRWTWLYVEYWMVDGSFRQLRVPAVWQSATWNGFPAPQLPEWIGYLVSLATENAAGLMSQPSLSDRESSALVHYDGLAWATEPTDEPTDRMHTCSRCGDTMLYWQQGDHDRQCPTLYANLAYRTPREQRRADRLVSRAMNTRRY